jgi:hypothetical protein
MGEFNFDGDDVGQCNVVKEHIKRVKTVVAMRSMCVDSILVVQICCLISLYHLFLFYTTNLSFQFVV